MSKKTFILDMIFFFLLIFYGFVYSIMMIINVMIIFIAIIKYLNLQFVSFDYYEKKIYFIPQQVICTLDNKNYYVIYEKYRIFNKK